MYILRTTHDNYEIAKDIIKYAVEHKFAASAHIHKVESCYVWEDELYSKDEYEVTYITEYPEELEKLIREKHEYKVPEVIYTKVHTHLQYSLWCSNWCVKGGVKDD